MSISRAKLHTPPTLEQRRLLVESMHGFYHDPDPTNRAKRADEALSLGFSEAVLKAAGMYIETARTPELPFAEREELFRRGNGTYQNLATRGRRNGLLLGDSAAAALRLSLSSAYEGLVLHDQIPAPAEMERGYSRFVHAAADIAHSIDIGVGKSHHTKDLIGCASEASVQLLLMRFAAREVPGEYAPFFSFATEDFGDGQPDVVRNRWDVSVFTQLEAEAPIDLAHKVQVKSSHAHSQSKGTYAKDIAVVHTLDDLRVDNHRMGLTTIIQECFYEREQGADRLTPTLDQRTSQLLEIMG